jgi:hypothetical protein
MFEWCKQVQVGVETQICEKFCAPTKNVSASSVPIHFEYWTLFTYHLVYMNISTLLAILFNL